MKKFLSAILAVLIIVTTVLSAGCSNQSGTSSANTDVQSSTNLGKLGFVTEMRKINIGAESGMPCAYIMRNTDNDVYVLTNTTDENCYLAEDTANIFKVTDGFKAKDIRYSSDVNSDGSSYELYFYILSEDNDVYKTTINPGASNISAPYNYTKPLTCETQKLDIPEKTSSIIVTKNSGNFALSDSGNVYAWYNYASGSESIDSMKLDKNGEETPQVDATDKDTQIGFSDGKRHDTPTKLQLSDIKKMIEIDTLNGYIAYLSNSGDIYRVSDSTTNDEKGKIIKLDNLSGIKNIYRYQDNLMQHSGRTIDINDIIIALTKDNKLVQCNVDSFNKGKLESKDYGEISEDTNPISIAFTCGSIIDGKAQNDDNFGNFVFKLNNNKYYQLDKDLDSKAYSANIEDKSYAMLVNDLWLTNDNEVYYYGYTIDPDFKIDSKVSDNVKAISLISSYSVTNYDHVGYDYLNLPKEISTASMLYFKDGSVKAVYKNDTKKYGNVALTVVDEDASIYGNGTQGVLVPTSDGKYNVCTKGSSNGESKVVDTIEIPD